MMRQMLELTPQARQYLRTKGMSLLDQKIFKIFSDEAISLAPFQGSKAIEKTQIIAWDTYTTRITGARLTISATPKDSPAKLTLRMNDDKIAEKEWGWFDTSAYSKSIEVADRLINGSNIFRITWESLFAHAIPVTVEGVSLSLLLSYEGIAGKTPTPPGAVTMPPLWQILTVGGIGLVAIVGVVMIRRK